MTAQQMWQQYTALHPTGASYEAWAFCGGGEAADRLARLVLAGTKTATASALIAYETEGEEPPKPGCYSVVLFDSGEAACVIRTDHVSIVPFDEVPARHAWLEGEGDRSLAYWRKVHRQAFAPDYEAAGRPFDEKGLCVLEEFTVVFRESPAV
ncbi:ASCH domain-containing protein [Gemmiger sp.]|uniref:ASCH domain-containing protein n=1 Tax=Gemmiger sp. TaxID=2049027 RepID=UPI003F0011DB